MIDTFTVLPRRRLRQVPESEIPPPPDTTAPLVILATVAINGGSIRINFDENVAFGGGGSGGWSVNASGGAVTLSAPTGAGTDALIYLTSRTIEAGESVLVSYTQPGSGIVDTAPATNALASFANLGVTNNSQANNSLLYPSAWATDWEIGVKTGVPGGIPTDRVTIVDMTQSPYNVDNTGVVDCTSALNTALAAAGSGHVIYFPAGTYKVVGIISPFNKGNFTIRGAGMGVTFFDMAGSGGVSIGTGSQFDYPPSGNVTTAPMSRGDTVINLPSTGDYTIGQIVRLSFTNVVDNALIEAGTVPVTEVKGLSFSRKQTTRIANKTSTTLTISPGIFHAPPTTQTAKVNLSGFPTYGVGLEDFTLLNENNSNTFSITFSDCIRCWVKNVESLDTSNYHLTLNSCVECEVRGSRFAFGAGGTNKAGILMLTCTACCIEDNIVQQVGPGVEMRGGCVGNVYARNIHDGISCGLNANHEPHNSYNLFEGNIVPWIQIDGYFGGASENTFLGNWITGTFYGNGPSANFMFSLNRFTRNTAVIGNVFGVSTSTLQDNPYSFGNPNLGNGAYTGTSQMSAGDFPASWATDAGPWSVSATITTRTSDTSCVATVTDGQIALIAAHFAINVQISFANVSIIYIVSIVGNVVTLNTANGALPAQGTAVTFRPGMAGFQEKDLDVEATCVLKGNYHRWGSGGAFGPGVPDGQEMGGLDIPVSLCRNTAPAFMSGYNWPPINAASPGAEDYECIPAGARFVAL